MRRKRHAASPPRVGADASAAQRVVTIASRFCGPPGAGNGGYVAGMLAAQFGDSAKVNLRAPAPLEKPLAVSLADGVATLRDGPALIAEARAASVDLEVPAPPPFAVAERALQSFRGYDRHLFPRCFVCGPERAPGDGLRIFPLPADRKGVPLAAAWRPDQTLADDAGRVRAEYLWGALDCPGGFTIPHAEGAMIFTGELDARIEHRPRAGEACVVMGWPIGREGRKHLVGAAVFTEAGVRCAVARAIWIEVPAKGTQP